MYTHIEYTVHLLLHGEIEEERQLCEEEGNSAQKGFLHGVGVEGSKKENVVIITEMSGNTIKAGFLTKVVLSGLHKGWRGGKVG